MTVQTTNNDSNNRYEEGHFALENELRSIYMAEVSGFELVSCRIRLPSYCATGGIPRRLMRRYPCLMAACLWPSRIENKIPRFVTKIYSG